MNSRHPVNPNLILVEGTEWGGLPLLSGHSPYIEQYLEGIRGTMQCALEQYRRTTAIRFDLRVPADGCEPDSQVISRFFESLQAKVNSHQLRKVRMGQRVHGCRLRYVWVRERSNSLHRHYHCCIFLNGDAYRFLGSYRSAPDANADREGQNLACRIQSAWSSALGLTWREGQGLVHFSANGVYRVDANAVELWDQYADLFRRLSYFAKAATKEYGKGNKNFDRSRH